MIKADIRINGKDVLRNRNIKLDDEDILREYMNQEAELFVGYTSNKKYEAIDRPFYSAVAKPNTVDPRHPYGVPRRFGRQKERTAAEVAAFNEYGGGYTPPRPFIRTCIQKNSRKWFNYFDKTWLQFPDIRQTLWKLGDKIKGDLSETVKEWSTPPNAPSTVMRKGFNNPLVDSGNMSSDFIEILVEGSGKGVLAE